LLKADGSAIEAAKKKAQELLVKIRAGEAFEELAKQFSDDPGSRNQGGDLSWIGLKAMPNKDFQDAVQALKKGEVSEPVVTQEGVHLIKVEDSQPEVIRSFAEVRGQLEMELKKEKALSEFNAQVDQFATLAYENPSSLAVVAGTLNLPIKTTGLFSRNDSHPKDSIFTNAKIVEAAFSQQVLKDRYNSDLIEIGEQQVVVIRIKDYVESKRKPLEEVKAEITTKLKQQKAQVEAQTLGKRLLEQLKQTSDSDSVVKAQNLSWSIPQWVERQDTRLKQPKIVSEAFKAGYPAKDKAIYQGMELENGDYALVAVLAVKDGIIIPTTASNPQSPSSKERQQQALGESEFNQLTEGLKVSAKIKEYSNKVLVEQNPG
jgi:peptidyl-prolyl cis-trans isomerase D